MRNPINAQMFAVILNDSWVAALFDRPSDARIWAETHFKEIGYEIVIRNVTIE